MKLEEVPLSPFCPPYWLKNPHLQTILPRVIRQPTPRYQRELHLDSTGRAQVAYDFVWATGKQAPSHDKRPLAVMFHGLEGSSHSPYAKAFANYATSLGWDAVVVHYQGCGGVHNRADVDYNAGDIAEVEHVLTRLLRYRERLVAVGVSLGGNMLAKYMGEYQDNAKCLGAVIVSAPVDLTTSAKSMHRFVARNVYTPYLLNSLVLKAAQKLDDPHALAALKHLKTLDEFDELYTAPRHGYGTASNYYRTASALPVLHRIQRPTLIISAKDDPFLGVVAHQKDVSTHVRLLYSAHGGHVGFIGAHGKRLHLEWLPKTTFEFFEWVLTSVG